MQLAPMERFVVFQVLSEWLVTYADRAQISYSTREEAETSAFQAADALATQGHAVSVVILPAQPDADDEHPTLLAEWAPQVTSNRTSSLLLSSRERAIVSNSGESCSEQSA